MALATFEWGPVKNLENQRKHKVSFSEAQYAFADSRRVIAEDLDHSTREKRFFCFGRVERGVLTVRCFGRVERGVLTVRFTYRSGVIRIFGAGFWRKGKAIYERENQVHR